MTKRKIDVLDSDHNNNGTNEVTGSSSSIVNIANTVDEIKKILFQTINDDNLDLFSKIVKFHCTGHTPQINSAELPISIYIGKIEDIKDEDGLNLIHRAAKKNSVKILAELVEVYKIDIFTPFSNGSSAIHFSAEGGALDSLKYIINKAKEINIDALNLIGGGGYSPTHFVVCKGHLKLLKYLVEECNISPNTPASDGPSKGCAPIHIAASTGHLEIVKYIAEQNPDALNTSILNGPWQGYLPIHFAAVAGRTETVKYFVEKDLKSLNAAVTDGPRKGWTTIHVAASKGHLEIVKYFVEKDLRSLNAAVTDGLRKGCAPIHFAAFNGHLETVKYFAKKDPSKLNVPVSGDLWQGWFLIHIAAFCGHLEIVKYIAKKDPDALNTPASDGPSKGCAAIHHASARGHKEIVTYLVKDHNVNLNSNNPNLIYCVSGSTIDSAKAVSMTKHLILLGASVPNIHPNLKIEIKNVLNSAQLVEKIAKLEKIDASESNHQLLLDDQNQDFICKLYRAILVRSNIACDRSMEDSYKAYSQKVEEKYLNIIPTKILNIFKQIIENSLSELVQHMDELEGQLLTLDGIDPEEFMSMKAVKVMKYASMGCESKRSDNLKTYMEKHPEYMQTGAIIKSFASTKHYTNVSELHYRMQRNPMIKEKFLKLLSQILPTNTKKIFDQILIENKKISDNNIIQDFINQEKMNEEKYQELLQSHHDLQQDHSNLNQKHEVQVNSLKNECANLEQKCQSQKDEMNKEITSLKNTLSGLMKILVDKGILETSIEATHPASDVIAPKVENIDIDQGAHDQFHVSIIADNGSHSSNYSESIE